MITRRTLHDDTGAIAIAALLMAVFLVATLYYVVGVGQAVVLRERMQDAADAAAFSAASMQARGMNVIALINMVMAAMLAVLVALRLAETLIVIAMTAIAAASFFAAPLASMIQPLAMQEYRLHNVTEKVKPYIMDSLQLLHEAAHAVREIVPLIAEIESVDTVLSHYKPPAQFGFVMPTRLTLPTQDDKYSVLCEHAADVAGDLALLPLRPIVGNSGLVHDVISDALEKLAGAAPGWFCGEAGAAPPSYERTYWEHYPVLKERQQCQKDAGSSPAASALCQAAEDAEQRSMPNPLTGRCDDDSSDSPCRERAAIARVACNPNDDDALRDYGWQEQIVRRTYANHAGVWTMTQEEREPPRLIFPSRSASGGLGEQDDARRPCPRGEARFEWNVDAQTTHDTADEHVQAKPVCSELVESTTNQPHGQQAERVDVTREVLDIYACDKQVKRKQTVKGFAGNSVVAESGQSSRTPQGIEDGIKLGEENLQLRAIVVGDAPAPFARKLQEVAAWGQQIDAGAWDALAKLGRFQVAQAEYYFDDPQAKEMHDAWLWHMSWRARLRRFRLPSSDEARRQNTPSQPLAADQLASPSVSLADACKLAGSSAAASCNGIESDLNSVDNILVH